MPVLQCLEGAQPGVLRVQQLLQQLRKCAPVCVEICAADFPDLTTNIPHDSTENHGSEGFIGLRAMQCMLLVSKDVFPVNDCIQVLPENVAGRRAQAVQ